jgi:hypothetical protein
MSGLWLQDLSARLGELGISSGLQLRLHVPPLRLHVPALTQAALAVTLLAGVLLMYLHR